MPGKMPYALLAIAFMLLTACRSGDSPETLTPESPVTTRTVETTGMYDDRHTQVASTQAARSTEIALENATVTAAAPLRGTGIAVVQTTATAAESLRAATRVTATAAAQQTTAARDAASERAAGMRQEVEQLLNETPPLPFAWPMPPLTSAQVDDARGCQIVDSVEGISLGSFADEDLVGALVPRTGCEWAQLAAEYARRAEPGSPVAGDELRVFTRLARVNPAFLFKAEIAERYYGRVRIVEAMPLANAPVTGAAFDFVLGGDGGGGHSTWTLLDSGKTFDLSGVAVSSCDDCPLGPVLRDTKVDPELAQNLAHALVNLVPVDHQTFQTVCDGITLNGNTLLLFESNQPLGIATHSTIGPESAGFWQLEYDGRAYLQYGHDYYDALRALLDAAEVSDVANLFGPDCGWWFDPLDLFFD